jgi:hypothetical protein
LICFVFFGSCSSSGSRRRFRVEAIKTEREKQQQTEVVPVEDSFPGKEPASLDGVDDPMVVPSNEEDWVVKLEQSVNIFLTVIHVPELNPPHSNKRNF